MVGKRLQLAWKLITSGRRLESDFSLYISLAQFAREFVTYLEEKAVDQGELRTLQAFESTIEERIKQNGRDK